jgi:hypothetical protein
MMKRPEPQKKESHICTEEEPWNFDICDADRVSHPQSKLVDVMQDKDSQTWEKRECQVCGQSPWRLPEGAPAQFHRAAGIVHPGGMEDCLLCFPPFNDGEEAESPNPTPGQVPRHDGPGSSSE